MKNKKRIESLRKEIDEERDIFNTLDEQVRNKIIKDFARVTEGERLHIIKVIETKLSENILANNNCLEDFSEKVKKELYKEMKSIKYIGAYQFVKEEIDKIKKEMKIRGVKDNVK